jgi:hypothetical protein
MRLAECCFRPTLFTSCYCCIKRAPITPVKEETLLRNRKVELLSIRSSVFCSLKAIGGLFYCLSKIHESQIHVENTLSIYNFFKLATKT